MSDLNLVFPVIADLALGRRYQRMVVTVLLACFVWSGICNFTYANLPPEPPSGPAPCDSNDFCCNNPNDPCCGGNGAGAGGSGGGGSMQVSLPGLGGGGGGKKCCKGNCDGKGNNMKPSATADPIYLKFGTVIEGATDLSLDGPGITWTQSRSYDSGLSGSGALGNRWITSNTEIYIVSTSSGKDVIYTASAKYSFSGDDSSGYSPPTGQRLTLVHNSANHEYWMTNIDTGALAIFHDFTVSTAGDRGRLKEFTSIAWQGAGKTGTTYSYTFSAGVLDSVTITTSDYQACSITSTFTGGRLSSLAVNDGTTLVQKVEYVYFDDLTSPSSDDGSSGDLVHVKVSTRAANDTGTSLTNVRHTLYRYWSGSRLKAVYDHASVMRALAHFSQSDPEWLLAQSDNQQVGGSGPKVKDFASRWFTYYDSDATTNSITTAWITNENLQSKYGGSNRDETNFVASERVGAGQCSTCGGATSSITRDYYYMQIDQGDDNDDNEVKYLVVEDTKDSTGAQYRKVYGLNPDGRKLRELFIDNPAVSPKYWCRSWILDPTDDWNNATPKPKKRYTLSEYRPPSAHNVTSSNVAQFLDPFDDGMGQWANDAATLRAASDTAAGPTYVYSYDDEGREISTQLKRGYNSTDLYYVSATDYGDGSTVPSNLPVKFYEYPAKVNTKTATPHTEWSVDYDFWDSTTKQRIRKATTTYPTISIAQNGSGVPATSEVWYDKAGRKRWEKDAEGYIAYFSYHKITGLMGYVALDVDPASLPTSATSGSTWVLADDDGDGNTTYDSSGVPSRATGLPTPLALVTRQEFNLQGQPTLLTNPGGDRHYNLYESARTIRFPYINSSGVPQMPTQVEVLNNERQTAAEFAVRSDYTAISASGGLPTGFSTEPGQDDYVSWTRYAYDDESGDVIQEDKYHHIPSSGTGTVSADFDRTVYQYDVQGRRTYTIQQISGAPSSGGNGVEQVTKEVYDKLSRVAEVQRGVSGPGSSDDMGTNYSNYPSFATVSKTYYDGGNDSTPLIVGDSHVTGFKKYYSASDYIETLYELTYRGHIRGIEQTNNGSTFNPRSVIDINWFGRSTGSALYTSSVSWTDVLTGDGYTDYLSGHSTSRNDWTKTTYSTAGQVCRTERYPGTEGTKHFESNNYYDRLGRLVAKGDKFSVNFEYAYDAAGRQYEQRTLLKLVDDDGTYGKYTSGGAFKYMAPTPNPALGSLGTTGEKGIVEFSHIVYDNAGNTTEQHTFELNHSDSNGIDIGSTTSYVRQTVFNWYDAANRRTTSADYGSGDATSGSPKWSYTARSTRPGEPDWTTPAVYDGYMHVMKFGYDPTSGRMDSVTAGIDKNGSNTKRGVIKEFYDKLGRRVAISENYVNYNAGADTGAGGGTNDEEDRVMKFAYNGLGQQTQNTAVNVTPSGTVNEVTRYLYEDPHDASLVTSTIYSDSSDTTSSGTDQVKMSYNLDGSPATRTDQREVELTLAYDDARRLKAEKVTSFGSTGTVDETVKAITHLYDDLGRPLKVTSHGNATDVPTNTTDVKNQVVYTRGTEGLVTKTEQSHSGAVTTGTPSVQYDYDTSATSNIYTNGLRFNTVTYPYSTTVANYGYGSSGTIDFVLNRVNHLTFQDLGADYSYNGIGRLALVGNGVTQVTLDLYQGTAGTYAGYDRFGHVVDQRWQGGSGDVVRIKYGYNYAGIRTWHEDAVAAANSETYDEFYTNDGLQRLVSFDRGALNGTKTGISGTPTKEQDWTLDQLGNWPGYITKTGGTTDLNQGRTHNEVNELTQIDSSSSHVAEDLAGNMIKVPKPASWSAHFDLKYDAWNRLVELKDGGPIVATMSYDGLGRRIQRVVGSDTYDYYYNENWQLLEERKNGASSPPQNQYLWHPYYIDALAIRLGSGSYYANLYDANYNVVAVVDDNGSVQERYTYSPYGEVKFLNDDFSVKSSQATSVGNTHYYTGRELDSETGLQLNRFRFYTSRLGRWVNRDPVVTQRQVDATGGPQISDEDGFNLYSYVGDRPTFATDPSGGWCVGNPGAGNGGGAGGGGGGGGGAGGGGGGQPNPNPNPNPSPVGKPTSCPTAPNAATGAGAKLTYDAAMKACRGSHKLACALLQKVVAAPVATAADKTAREEALAAIAAFCTDCP